MLAYTIVYIYVHMNTHICVFIHACVLIANKDLHTYEGVCAKKKNANMNTHMHECTTLHKYMNA